MLTFSHYYLKNQNTSCRSQFDRQVRWFLKNVDYPFNTQRIFNTAHGAILKHIHLPIPIPSSKSISVSFDLCPPPPPPCCLSLCLHPPHLSLSFYLFMSLMSVKMHAQSTRSARFKLETEMRYHCRHCSQLNFPHQCEIKSFLSTTALIEKLFPQNDFSRIHELFKLIWRWR